MSECSPHHPQLLSPTHQRRGGAYGGTSTVWSCDQATWILSMGWLLGCLSAPAKASMDSICFDNRKVSDSGLQGPGFRLLGCECSQMGQCWLQWSKSGTELEASLKHDLPAGPLAGAKSQVGKILPGGGALERAGKGDRKSWFSQLT